MRYDGNNPLHAQQARTRLEQLIRRGDIFDLTRKAPTRSLDQNAYLHVIIAYFASQYGETARWVKERFYKELVNPQLFVRHKSDRILGDIRYLRSSAELDTAEMTLSIDRFRHWSAETAGIYLPSPDESRLLELARLEAERSQPYI